MASSCSARKWSRKWPTTDTGLTGVLWVARFKSGTAFDHRRGTDEVCVHSADAKFARLKGNRGKPSIRAAHLAPRVGHTYGCEHGRISRRALLAGVTAVDVDAVARRLTELGDDDATFVASTLIPADEVVFFEFRADDEAAVRELARRAELRCDRLVSADRQPHAY